MRCDVCCVVAESLCAVTPVGNGEIAIITAPSLCCTHQRQRSMSDLFGGDEVPVTEGQYVSLVSGDGSRRCDAARAESTAGHQFFVSRKCAISSNTIKEMLSGPGASAACCAAVESPQGSGRRTPRTASPSATSRWMLDGPRRA